MFTPSPSVRTATPNTHEGAGGGTLSVVTRSRSSAALDELPASQAREECAKRLRSAASRPRYFIAAFDNPFSPLEVSFQVLSEFACRTAKQIELDEPAARTEEGHGIWSVPHTHAATRVWLRSMHVGELQLDPEVTYSEVLNLLNYEGIAAPCALTTAARVSKPPLAIDRLQGLSDRVRVVCDEVADALLSWPRLSAELAGVFAASCERRPSNARSEQCDARVGRLRAAPEPAAPRRVARRALPPGSNASGLAFAPASRTGRNPSRQRPRSRGVRPRERAAGCSRLPRVERARAAERAVDALRALRRKPLVRKHARKDVRAEHREHGRTGRAGNDGPAGHANGRASVCARTRLSGGNARPNPVGATLPVL